MADVAEAAPEEATRLLDGGESGSGAALTDSDDGTTAAAEDGTSSKNLQGRASIADHRGSMAMEGRRSTGRAQYRNSIRRSSLRSSILTADEAFEELLRSTGALTDYLVRFWRKERLKPPPERREATQIIKLLMTGDSKSRDVQVAGFSYSVRVLRREELRHGLMQGITQESKARNIFPQTYLDTAKHWVRHFMKTKRQLRILTAEVNSWRVRMRLKRTAEPGIPESIWNKKERLEHFWSDFHDRSRILENGPVGPRGLPGGLSSPSRPTTRGGLDASSRPTTRGGLVSRPNTAASAWTDASGVEQPESFGMRWDFDQALQWKTFDSRLLTNTQRLESLSKKQSEANLGLKKVSSLPSLGASRPRSSGSADSMDYGGRLGTPASPGGDRGRELPPLKKSGLRLWQECDARQTVPMPLHFLTGNSQRLIANNKGLTDKDLMVMAAMIQESPVIEEINLYENMLITDKGMTKIMLQLTRPELKDTLHVLSVGRCCRLGSYTLDSMVKLLQLKGRLLELNLSQVPISTRFQLPLCRAIGQHPCLENVNVAETGIQSHDMTSECIGALLSSRTLKALDIGWNNFDGKVMKALGYAVVSSRSLNKLSIVNCAATTDTWGRLQQKCPVSSDDFVPPLSRFLEMLAQDKSLTHLDISMNRCDYRTALILEDALDTHSQLSTIAITDNPLGIAGFRPLLRLLCRDHTGLTFVDTEACYSGASPSPSAQVFSYTNPGGKYELQMWDPYHRALMRMLYKTAEHLGIAPEESFKPPDEGSRQIDWKPIPGRGSAPWTHPASDANGVRQLPDSGDIRFVFDVQWAIFKKFMQGGPGGIAETDYGGFLRSFYETMRFRPGFRKVIPLCARWCELTNDSMAQDVFLLALSRDFNLTLPVLEFFTIASKIAIKKTICSLLPALGADSSCYFFTGLLLPWVGDYLFCQVKTKSLVEFNLDNPTGHYKLDLANRADCAVAERLLLLDRWEAALDEKHSRFDTTGNKSHIRNEVWAGRSLLSFARSAAEWKMPEHGEFELDFISNQRPSRKAQIISTPLWERLLKQCYEADCEPEDKIAALRSISHLFFLSSGHMRALIGYFKEESQRANVFIIFYLRIVDMHNSKLFRVRFENDNEVRRLQSRLGYASFFPFLQPENSKFELDLGVYDQRLCACMYVHLCGKESFPRNLHEYGYRVDGTDQPLPLGVPRSWADMKGIPQKGLFRAMYRCSPEDRNFSCRKEMAQKYGFFDVEGLKEDEVSWWTGLTEPPEDVLNLLEFFISRYATIAQAFTDIDGVDGNGEITIVELKEGLEAMDCRKFDTKKGTKGGLTKEQRIDAIFRYLDPSGGGSVSREEWNVLDQLWKEFDLSIKEFVHFLMLSFDSLTAAWNCLDDDGSGELNETEWLDAVHNVGYFGPAKIVFALLDSSDDGNISFDEFEVLEKYKPSHEDA